MSKHISKSLRLQLFFATLTSLLVAAAVFGISFFLGDALLDKTAYGHSIAKRMADQQFSKLQDYVETEEISLDNLQRLNAWCSRGEKVYLTIYDGDKIVYEYQTHSKSKKELDAKKYDPDMEASDNEYFLTLHGDVEVRAFLYYYAGDAVYFWMAFFSGLLAFLAFSVCFVLLINKKIAYITQLKHELDILSGGQLDYAVTVKGRDELGELAAGIDQMRCYILEHQEIENQILTANSELITAMSHDLRTPLTSLLAYLEIIDRKKCTDEEQMQNLIHKSVEQTVRIKNMADKLFQYALVYATQWESAELEAVDADELLLQILEDYAYSLESSGLTVEKDFSQVSGMVKANTELLQRALDNLCSNLLKYADPEQAVRFMYKRENSSLILSISNKVGSSHTKNESTSIGLNTCRRIIGYHGGVFSASEEQDVFTVMIELPLL